MNRISLLHRMDVLLESCKGCTRPDATPEIKCKGCNTYAQLKEIGRQLEGGIKVRKALTKEQYNDLRNKGLNDKEIAHKFEMSKATLYNRKLSWGIIKKQAITVAEKDIETQSIHTDKNREYRQLIDELNDKLNSEKESHETKDKLIAELKAKVTELESIPESELASLKAERDNYRNQLLETRDKLIRKDYAVENQTEIIKDHLKLMDRYKTENKALRELVALWI